MTNLEGRITLVVPDEPKPGNAYRIAARYVDDFEHGATTYEITASRASGVVVVYADLDDPWNEEIDLDDPKVRIEIGRCRPAWRPGGYESEMQMYERGDRLTINGIALYGRVLMYADDLRSQRPSRINIYGRRDLPPATHRRAAAILGAVVTHWLTRDPHALVLRLATARHAAFQLLGRQRESVKNKLAQIDELQRQIRDVESRAAETTVFLNSAHDVRA